MNAPLDRIRMRLVPAVLTAAGVTLVAAGLLSYTGPVDAGVVPDASPTIVSAAPTPTPSARPSTSPSAAPSPSPSAPAVPADRVATRVVVPALGIDMPIVRQPGGASTYPLCDVAMYIQVPPGQPSLSQPGQGRATYLYAHARDGMFGPIYERAIRRRDPDSMLGMLVQVYTSDDQLFLYEVNSVRLHQTSLDDAVTATTEQVWLQTSEGPKGTVGKTQVIARFLSSGPADHAEAHPVPKPVVCG